MSNSEKTATELIAQIHAFIKREREQFGDFSTDSELVESIKKDHNQPTTSTAISAGNDETEMPSSKEPGTNERLQNCTDLDELEQICRESEELKTDLEGTQLVFGVGNRTADLMVIGEAPGEEEDRQGEPFVGKAGQLLDKIMAAIDLSRDKVYIANILKHRPPNNRDPKPKERQRSLPYLEKQIELINPKLILSLGKVSAQTLLNSNESLGRMRGKFHSYRDKYELLATYHPAALLRNPKWKRPTWEDMQMLRERYDALGGEPS